MAVHSVISKEEENGLRLQLVRGKIEERLLLKYHQHYPRDPRLLYQEIKKNERRLKELMRVKIIYRAQYDILLPTLGFTYSSQFDTSLLLLLLREFCGFKEPLTGWNRDPHLTDRSDEANLVRFRKGRNEIQHGKLKISNTKFQQLFGYLKTALEDYNTPPHEINDILTCELDQQLLAKLNAEQRRADHLESHLSGVIFGVFPSVYNFLGRDNELVQLHENLTNLIPGKLGLVVSGLGGIGKSELCRKYCEEYGSRYFCNNVLWLNGDSESSLEQSFQTVAELINLTVTDNNGYPFNPYTIVNKVYNYFGRRKLLLVFDNVDNYKILQNYLPSSQNTKQTSVLITSQNKNCTDRFSELQLKVFSIEKATEFLYQNLPGKYNLNAQNNEYLIMFLQCHPLALQQAVSYMTENKMNVDQFNKLLDEQASVVLKETSAVDIGQKSVMTTFSIALNNLKKNSINTPALQLLNLICFLDGNSIKRGILYETLNKDIVETNRALKTLKTYSLINFIENIETEDFNDQLITIHSLVQLAIQSDQNESKMKHYEDLLNVIFKEGIGNDSEPFYKQKHWCDHMMHIFNQSDLRELFLLKAMKKQKFLFEIFRMRAMYNDLQQILESIKDMLEKNTTEENRRVLKETQYNIAIIMDYNKHYDEALEILKQIEQDEEGCNSTDILDLLLTQSSIATCYFDKKHYDEALNIFTLIEIFELKIYEKGDPLLLTTQSNIALCYLNKKDFEEALQILQNVEYYKLKLYNIDNPELLLTQSNIASCLFAKKNYEEALDILRHVEEYQSKIYDEEHPNLKNTRNGIRICLQRMKKNAKCVKCVIS